MKIRNKILSYFSSTVITLIGLMLLIIYLFFSAHREEEFQQRQKEKISTTLKFLSQVRQTDEKLIESIDQITINDIYDEKLLLFDSQKKLIYSSVDDTPIPVSKEVLSELNADNKWFETKEGKYDVVGTYIETQGNTYYGISKAYDTFGYSKLAFLRNTLITLFFVISAIVMGLSVFLAKRISQPITDLAELVDQYVLSQGQLPKNVVTTTYEINHLNDKFNQLLKRVDDAFIFQKHSIHHISHQLKTPLAVTVSELEMLARKVKDLHLRQELEAHAAKTRLLADTINVLLMISKVEAGQVLELNEVRVDEILFDCIDELTRTRQNLNFEVNYLQDHQHDAERLTMSMNAMLVRQVFLNLLDNSVIYSDNQRSTINLDCSSPRQLSISIVNTGTPLSSDEQKYLFSHFFRGENSRGMAGSGLGLALAKKIIEFHAGTISYTNPSGSINIFEVRFPLS